MAQTRAQKNRAVRQAALREQLEMQGHVQHIVDIVDKVRDPSVAIEPDMLQRYKLAIDTKLKLVDKYLPTEKYVESSITQEATVKLPGLINLVARLDSGDD